MIFSHGAELNAVFYYIISSVIKAPLVALINCFFDWFECLLGHADDKFSASESELPPWKGLADIQVFTESGKE